MISKLLMRFFSSDFENKFVCGEIMSYTDLKEHGSEAAVKAVSLYTIYSQSKLSAR